MSEQFDIKWHDHGREPQCAPNPKYPTGIDIDLGPKQSGCMALLPYPARRCGFYEVRCQRCGYSAAVTTAGRPDDPRSVRLPCKTKAN